jgi:hypothetical protein
LLSFQYAVHPLFYCCSIGHYKLLTPLDKWYRLPPRFALVHNDVWTCHLTFPTAVRYASYTPLHAGCTEGCTPFLNRSGASTV